MSYRIDKDTLGEVPNSITAGYGGDQLGIWGETDPEELLNLWISILEEKQKWKDIGIKESQKLRDLSWSKSMEKFINELQTRDLLKD